ncbi:Putative Remark: A. niger EST an_3119 has the database entry number EMBLEST:BE758865 (Precursor) [Penicillium brasilianum]|uniref:Putative Remark: A. niger EST an_3119 has the database entry number EMBLEST:BE758865 (Precursor) n=1 Tax=Penicillium brasilianum TaxID=104259 RepID=A0A0F7TTD1_PENBI|nr:Putative Remark: A. niger EST an_3119 has the database entry number EMBLEST:BE758865 (Precursor) [Penicillium brasilianum]
MELNHLSKSLARRLIFFSPVHHLFSRSLSTSTSSTLKDSSKNPSTQSSTSTNSETPSTTDKQPSIPNKTKTTAQADAELRERLERMSGDGGAAGIEYEDGKPSAMKRGVRNNMFRLI